MYNIRLCIASIWPELNFHKIKYTAQSLSCMNKYRNALIKNKPMLTC